MVALNMPHVFAPHFFDIRQSRHGCWVVRDRNGSIRRIFLSRRRALRYALFRAGGDGAFVHSDPVL